MSVTRDIVATYKGPGRVVARMVARGQREDRALIILMVGCIMVFVAQWPRLARQAYLTGEELNMLLGGTLLAWLFIMPLLLYVMALVTHLGARLFGGKGTGYGARLALFWALLASSPVLLLHGLVAGFIGSGTALDGVGILWLTLFGWFWIAGLIRIEWGGQSDPA
ncbi:MAG: YIP1 family protein [Thalassovita sp.]|nr:YIP1 family protein [Thalassovita sp.]